jgi:hypothetical protein
MARSTATAPKAQAPEPEAEVEAEGEADETVEVTEAEAKTRHMPTYDVEVVDELPEETPGGRKRLYFDLLSKAAEHAGSWVKIAHFQTPTGARNAQRDIENGTRQIPDGDWSFKAIKVPNPDSPAAPRHSQLYARLNSEEAA